MALELARRPTINAGRANIRRQQGGGVVGYSEAQIYADAQAACRAYGLVLYDRNYDICVQREYAARRPV